METEDTTEAFIPADEIGRPPLKLRFVNLDTGRENVAVISRRSLALRPDVFRGFSRIQIQCGNKLLLATLLITDDETLVGTDELGLATPAFRRLSEPENTLARVSPAPPPKSLDFVRSKIQGEILNAPKIQSIVDDLTSHRYSDLETAAFLVATARLMTTDELISLTSSMAKAGTRLRWQQPMIVDKHCIGGIPGNRTSMIVVPIVAAHGLTMPKTSSRAITSPAGTADTMEVLAKVDIDTDRMKQVVEECGGCLIWGGHVNLSPADDILISVERVLSLDTVEQLVASIMSKKVAAGVTHLLVDIPVGSSSKIRTPAEALRLRKLFELVGDHFGIAVEVVTTEGRQPIGRGIGPLLEVQDVMSVLENRLDAPQDLREKSLHLAARLLEYDPALRGGTGYARALELLESGAALRKLRRIIAAQGDPPYAVRLGHLQTDVAASKHGIISGIDCLRINRIARIAGAPIDKGAGIQIFKKIGDHVSQGDPLYRIFASEASGYDLALRASLEQNGISIDDPPSLNEKFP